MDLGLKGKKAIVTGGTRGIGRAIADLLCEEGCDVGICARDAAQVEEAVAAFKAKGVNAVGSAVDVADGARLVEFIRSSAEALGGLDIFISNVSAMGTSNSESAWQKSLEVDVLGTVRGCEAALPYLEQSGAGAIVVIGSVSSVEVGGQGPRQAYSGVKAAVLPYIKALARDVAAKKRTRQCAFARDHLFQGRLLEHGRAAYARLV